MYDEHVWRVYAFLAYRVHGRERAEDLTQATFERALRAWSRFDPRRGSESTWLLAIARNLLIDDHRRDRPELIDPIDERDLPAIAGPEERISGLPHLDDALSRLNDREREVIALRFGGDLTARTTAELLGLSLANVQQITSRSLRKLRGWLEAPDADQRGQDESLEASGAVRRGEGDTSRAARPREAASPGTSL